MVDEQKQPEKNEKGLLDIAEVRMVLYVVPVAIIITLLGYFFWK